VRLPTVFALFAVRQIKAIVHSLLVVTLELFSAIAQNLRLMVGCAVHRCA
jgi:hypothetical protein